MDDNKTNLGDIVSSAWGKIREGARTGREVVANTVSSLKDDVRTGVNYVAHTAGTFAGAVVAPYVIPSVVVAMNEHGEAHDQVLKEDKGAMAGMVTGMMAGAGVDLVQAMFIMNTWVDPNISAWYTMVPVGTNIASGIVEGFRDDKKSIDTQLPENLTWGEYAGAIARVTGREMKKAGIEVAVAARDSIVAGSKYLAKAAPEAGAKTLEFVAGTVVGAVGTNVAPYAMSTAYRLFNDHVKDRPNGAYMNGMGTGAVVGMLGLVAQTTPWVMSAVDPAQMREEMGFALPAAAYAAAVGTNIASLVGERVRSSVMNLRQPAS